MIQAKQDSFKVLYSILKECSNWLKSRNISQWNNPSYPEERFMKDIDNGNVYYFERDKEIIGTVTIYHEKPSYYPKNLWNEPINAWYICRLAVPRKKANNRYGDLILKEIESQAKGKNVVELRLDVIKSNPFLETYYSKAGFKSIVQDEIFGEDTIFMNKFL